jgi:hypothetical protein
MSKNQNHGKMKEWRKPEYDSEGDLIKQERYKRRKTKGSYMSTKGWMSPLMVALFQRVGLINKAMPQV